MKILLESTKKCILVIIFYLTSTFNTYAIEVTVGDTTINIPPFSGFSEISSISTETFETYQDMCPPTNRLLAVFLTQDDAGRILLGKPPIFNQYMSIQSSKEFEAQSLTKAQFGEIQKRMRKQWDSIFQESSKSIDQLVEKAEDVFSNKYDIEMVFKFVDVVPFGVDLETASSITMSLLAKLNIRADGENTESVMAGTVSFLLVKGKVIFLYVYKIYRDENDIKWVRKTAEEYIKQILSANETILPLATGSIVPEGTTVNIITKKLLTGDYTEYNLKSHPKAQGLDISLKYPQSWEAKEGIRPHIVQKFVGQPAGGIAPMCMVIVMKMPIEAELFLKEEVPKELLQEFLPEDSVFVDGGQTKMDGEPCIWLKYYSESERAGVRAGIYTLQYTMFYEGRMFAVQSSVVSTTKNKYILEEEFNAYLPVFQMIGNSVVINEKWTNPNTTTKSEEPIMKSSELNEKLDKLTLEEIETTFEILQEAREHRVCSLRGLKGVAPWVMVSGETSLDSSVNEKDLKNEVEHKLRVSGIKVYSDKERLKDRINIPALCISVSIRESNQKVAETHLYVVTVSAELYQEVDLVRNPKIRTEAVTWKVCFAAQVISEEKLERLVRDYALTYTSMFIWDYFAANPKEEPSESISKTHNVD